MRKIMVVFGIMAVAMGLLASHPVAAQDNVQGQAASTAPAMTQDQLLYSFVKAKGSNDDPETGLVRDAAGNLYGTTDGFGDDVAGSVFELSPQSGGGWVETTVHTFSAEAKKGDGNKPSGLIIDAAGNLYGVTSHGGNGACDYDGFGGCGIVFELSQFDEKWTEAILYNFQLNEQDGSDPAGNLTFDAAGNLYGTTLFGGTTGLGTVFELSPKAGGGWTESLLHGFGGSPADGAFPASGVVLDQAGNIYGATSSGGLYDGSNCQLGCGTVFELSPTSGTEAVLHSFSQGGTDGYEPQGGLIFDMAGNLYGVANEGGDLSCYSNDGCGIIYELSPKSGGAWKENILHTFGVVADDGEFPGGALVFDTAGNLYGTTEFGGSHTCAFGAGNLGCGTVYELSPRSAGGWKETILHNFRSGHGDAHLPTSNVIFDPQGNLYGTGSFGGAYGGGAVYEFTP